MMDLMKTILNYGDIPLWLSFVFTLGGLALLAWSADRFIAGAGAVARAFGVSPFIIGMVIIGFGTSAPELVVSAVSGLTGHSDLSLGNAYGSDIFNIAVILGVAALIWPIKVKPLISFCAVPLLVGASLLSCLLVSLGGGFSRLDGVLVLAVFAVVMPLYCWYEQREKKERACAASTPVERGAPSGKAWAALVGGLALLVASSHVLVWGAVDLARAFGVSELMIGLTIIAAGTSLPELASAVASARRGQHEFVLGNIVGSNLFNTLAVVGVAGTLSPFKNVSANILARDLPTMVLMSLSILVFGVNYRRPRRSGRVQRWEGVLWLVSFAVYFAVMFVQETGRGA